MFVHVVDYLLLFKNYHYAPPEKISVLMDLEWLYTLIFLSFHVSFYLYMGIFQYNPRLIGGIYSFYDDS